MNIQRNPTRLKLQSNAHAVRTAATDRLRKRSTVPELGQIREVFGLTKAEMADLLNRRAQTIVEWEVRGIPRETRATVERLLDLSQLFKKRIIASRIPEIVRTKDEWLGNRTILETLRADGVDPIYSYLGRLFSYSGR